LFSIYSSSSVSSNVFLLLLLFFFIEYLDANSTEYLKDGSTLPSSEEIYQARLFFDSRDEAKQKCFILLTTIIIPSIVGPKAWTLLKQRKQTMSAKGKGHGKPDGVVVTTSDMGLGLIMWDNISEKMFAYWKKKTSPQKHASDPVVKAKYTDAHSGGRENSGWLPEGHDGFNDFTQRETEAREDEASLKSEKDALKWYV